MAAILPSEISSGCIFNLFFAASLFLRRLEESEPESLESEVFGSLRLALVLDPLLDALLFPEHFDLSEAGDLINSSSDLSFLRALISRSSDESDSDERERFGAGAELITVARSGPGEDMAEPLCGEGGLSWRLPDGDRGPTLSLSVTE